MMPGSARAGHSESSKARPDSRPGLSLPVSDSESDSQSEARL